MSWQKIKDELYNAAEPAFKLSTLMSVFLVLMSCFFPSNVIILSLLLVSVTTMSFSLAIIVLDLIDQ